MNDELLEGIILFILFLLPITCLLSCSLFLFLLLFWFPCLFFVLIIWIICGHTPILSDIAHVIPWSARWLQYKLYGTTESKLNNFDWYHIEDWQWDQSIQTIICRIEWNIIFYQNKKLIAQKNHKSIWNWWDKVRHSSFNCGIYYSCRGAIE